MSLHIQAQRLCNPFLRRDGCLFAHEVQYGLPHPYTVGQRNWQSKIGCPLQRQFIDVISKLDCDNFCVAIFVAVVADGCCHCTVAHQGNGSLAQGADRPFASAGFQIFQERRPMQSMATRFRRFTLEDNGRFQGRLFVGCCRPFLFGQLRKGHA